MKDLQQSTFQQSTLLEQELDFRAARTLCRDGWSCEQINVVLKHVSISQEQFETMQEQSKELDELQKVFGAPADSMNAGHTEPNQSELDFLNRGPDAAADVLRENGWSNHEVSLVIQDSMFPNVEPLKMAPQAVILQHAAVSAPAMAMPATAFPPQVTNGYAMGGPNSGIAAMPYPAATQGRVRRGSRSTLVRDTLILAFMAGIALALVFTLL
ncbi:MAG: hypothetical protein AAF821_19950 [Cyanobacteria bacterium P01_D01_bin.156]